MHESKESFFWCTVSAASNPLYVQHRETALKWTLVPCSWFINVLFCFSLFSSSIIFLTVFISCWTAVSSRTLSVEHNTWRSLGVRTKNRMSLFDPHHSEGRDFGLMSPDLLHMHWFDSKMVPLHLFISTFNSICYMPMFWQSLFLA